MADLLNTMPAPLPSLTSALSRRDSLFGAVAVIGALGAAAPTVTMPSPTLAGLVSEFEMVMHEARALLRLPYNRGIDANDIPGWTDRDDRLRAITQQMYDLRAESLVDVVLVARFLQMPIVHEDRGVAADLGFNLADDILRLHSAGRLGGQQLRAA